MTRWDEAPSRSELWAEEVGYPPTCPRHPDGCPIEEESVEEYQGREFLVVRTECQPDGVEFPSPPWQRL